MKRVLITGGSRGIGAACVRKFAAAGDRVVFLYNKSVDAAVLLAAETGAIAIQVDVSDGEALTVAVREAERRLGGLDVLVNNAGISLVGLFTDMTDGEWQTVLNTNLSAATLASREASRGMIQRHSGRIINIGSVWGRVGASCEVAYSATKAGLEGLTRALAKELGPSGITVNCVEPGVIATDMNACFDDATIGELCDATPLCRIGQPEDVANAVFWLASEESSFVTGQIIGVDGGFCG